VGAGEWLTRAWKECEGERDGTKIINKCMFAAGEEVQLPMFYSTV
jgi:hypothetical protein